ncbi:MAG TPA: hypothetical protein VMP01_12185 [Pirellulaceae bacterium]|nr:hypothetical protein [Pirellulaceae bacterium]
MNRHHPTLPSEQVHPSVAVRELISRDSDYDTSSSAWGEFDHRMTEQFATLELQMRHYFTPVAIRKGLGR